MNEEVKEAILKLWTETEKILRKLAEPIKELAERMKKYETVATCRPPAEIKKEIKHEKNPMRLKQLNQELNRSYKAYKKPERR